MVKALGYNLSLTEYKQSSVKHRKPGLDIPYTMNE